MLQSLSAITIAVVAFVTVICIAIIVSGYSLTSTPFNVARRRKASDKSNPALPGNMAAVLTVVATKLRVTLPDGFSLSGLPRYGATGGAHVGTEYPVSATIISPTVVDLAYTNITAAANVVVIPDHDPAIRSRSGGYVSAQTKTLA